MCFSRQSAKRARDKLLSSSYLREIKVSLTSTAAVAYRSWQQGVNLELTSMTYHFLLVHDQRICVETAINIAFLVIDHILPMQFAPTLQKKVSHLIYFPTGVACSPVRCDTSGPPVDDRLHCCRQKGNAANAYDPVARVSRPSCGLGSPTAVSRRASPSCL